MGVPLHKLSIAQYLAWENAQAGRSEFFRGEVFAMVGRSEKFAIYRKLASLREYVLVDPDTRRSEVYRPLPDGSCTFFDMSEQADLVLESINCKIPLSQLFKGMDSDA